MPLYSNGNDVMTWLGALNFCVFQWGFLRLARIADSKTGEHLRWKWLFGVVPLTGWWSKYLFVRLPKRVLGVGLVAVAGILSGCHKNSGSSDSALRPTNVRIRAFYKSKIFVQVRDSKGVPRCFEEVKFWSGGSCSTYTDCSGIAALNMIELEMQDDEIQIEIAGSTFRFNSLVRYPPDAVFDSNKVCLCAVLPVIASDK